MDSESKKVYIPITTIRGKKAADGSYNLSALDVKRTSTITFGISPIRYKAISLFPI